MKTLFRRAYFAVVHWFLRGAVSAELEPGVMCAIPGCDRPASEQWLNGFCPLRNADVPTEWAPVCTEHDIEVNEASARQLYGRKHDAALTAYRKLKLKRPVGDPTSQA